MQVAKWGNSLAIRLPKQLVDELHLKEGDVVDVVAASGSRLEVERNTRREQALAALAAANWPSPEAYRFDRDEANER